MSEELKKLEPAFLNDQHTIWQERVRLKQAYGFSLESAGDDEGAAEKFREAIAEHRQALRSEADSWSRLTENDFVELSYKGLLRIDLEKRHDAASALAEWEIYRKAPLMEPAAANPKLAIDSVRLVYVSLPEGIAAFAQDSRSISGRMLDVRQEDVQIVERRFLRSCAHPDSDVRQMQDDARQLYRWLVEPFLQELRGAHTVIIDADGWVASVPFPALRDEGGRYLIEDFAIAMFSPLSRSEAGGAARMTHSDRALIVAVPSPGGGISPLAFSNDEASHVASQLEDARVLSGVDASIESIRAAAPGARVFHFIGHGWSNGGDGGLILSTPGNPPVPAYLTAATLARFDWSNCALAVLSACMTGAGESRGPSNPRSLVRAFLASGARRVVAARWNLDEAASSVLMERFYASVVDSAVPAKSLAIAQREVLHHAEYHHPYYWAAFAIFGEL